MIAQPVDAEPRPLARLRLAKRSVPRERAPVFHVFEELYARAAAREHPELQPRSDRR